MIGSKAMKRAKPTEINQTKCWIATSGHIWMKAYFDGLPRTVRRRLRGSPFNLCAACLVTKFAPQIQSRHPGYSHEKALLAAIELMESEVRRG
jgi:hypothetical protein